MTREKFELSLFVDVLKEISMFKKYYHSKNDQDLSRNQINATFQLTNPERYGYLTDISYNPLVKLYQYLHTIEPVDARGKSVGSFLTLQRELLKVGWAFFAFVESKDKDKDLLLKYLYTTHNPESESNKTLPHFILRSSCYNAQSNTWEDDCPVLMDYLAQIHLKLRNSKSLNFAKLLTDEGDNSSLSEFEQENEILYIPSGEIDFFCLNWVCIQFLKSKKHDEQYFSMKEILDPFYTNIHELDSRKSLFSDKVTSWENHLIAFGLLELDAINATEKGSILLEWVSAKGYRQSPKFNGNHNDLRFEFFETQNDCEKLLTIIHTFLQAILQKGMTEQSDKKLQFAVRLNLPINVLYRYGKRSIGFRLTTSCGTIAYTSMKNPEPENEVGFFLSTFKDSTVEGRNYGLHLSNDEVRQEFEKLITKSKTIFCFLGDVEYREIYMNGIQMKLREQQKRQARKSAHSIVFSRANSHNLGHVLSNLVSEDFIKNLIDTSFYDKDKFAKKLKSKMLAKSQVKNFTEKQFSVLFSYLKTRMDFMADIATSTPTIESPKLFYNEIIRVLEINILLLRLISGVHDFEYTIVVKIDGFKPTDTGFKDCIASIPNDILGVHAIFLILENIIRNTAKYYETQQQNHQVCFTLNIKSSSVEHNYIEFEIFDNIVKANIDAVVQNQNRYLNTPVLQDSLYTLRDNGWGMIEMSGCAAYLRKVSLEDVDDDTQQMLHEEQFNEKVPDRLQAFEKDNCLGYRFYLMKPKDVLIIDEWEHLDNISSQKRFYLQNRGVLILNQTEDKNNVEENIWLFNSARVYTHLFGIYVADTNSDLRKIEKFLEEHVHSLPQKIIIVTNLKITKQLRFCAFINLIEFEELLKVYLNAQEEFNQKVFLQRCWQIWLKSRYALYQIQGIHFKGRPKYNGHRIMELSKEDIYVANDEYAFKKASLTHHESNYSTEFNRRNNNKEYIHVEAYSSAVKYLVDNIGADAHINWNNYYSFLNAITTRIAIVDERIQKNAMGSFWGVKKIDEFNKNQIFMPLPEVLNLNHNDFGLIEYDLKSWITSISKNLDYLVLHLGILEKILSLNQLPATYINIENLINSLIQGIEHKPKVVIISGRGKPSNIPKNMLFLNYSVISQYCIDTKFKYLLVNALSNARRPSK